MKTNTAITEATANGTTVRLATLTRHEMRISKTTGGFDAVGGSMVGADFLVDPSTCGKSYKTEAGAMRAAVRWLERKANA